VLRLSIQTRTALPSASATTAIETGLTADGQVEEGEGDGFGHADQRAVADVPAETIGAGMVDGPVAESQQVSVAGTGAGHAQGAIQTLVGELSPAETLANGNGLGGGRESEIGRGVVGAEAVAGWQQTQAFANRVAIEADVFEVVTGVVGQATAVREQVAECHLGLVPVQAPFPHHRGHHGGSQGLGE